MYHQYWGSLDGKTFLFFSFSETCLEMCGILTTFEKKKVSTPNYHLRSDNKMVKQIENFKDGLVWTTNNTLRFIFSIFHEDHSFVLNDLFCWENWKLLKQHFAEATKKKQKLLVFFSCQLFFSLFFFFDWLLTQQTDKRYCTQN